LEQSGRGKGRWKIEEKRKAFNLFKYLLVNNLSTFL
jgi:hypothetical protein